MIDQSLIIKYLEGTLSPEESREVLEWLQESPENKEYLFSMKSGLLVLNAGKDRKAADTDREWRLLKKNLTGGERIRISWRPFAVAAGLALLFSLGWILGHRNTMPERMAGDITIRTGIGQQSGTCLPDGTAVLLNDCSTLTYNPLAWKKSRKVSLSGQASFDVVHMDKFPFLVDTDHYQVEVTGTSFDIACYPDEVSNIVSLKDGRVSVCFPGGSQTAMLSPGESLIYNTASRTYTIQRLPEKQIYAWEEKAVSFKDQTLTEKSGELYRRYGYRLEIDDSCANDTFTALFDEESVSDVLVVIAQISPDIRYRIDSEQKNIRIWK